MSKLIDLTGQKFGRLTVLGIDHKQPCKNSGTRIYWRCRCDCGKITAVEGSHLKSGRTKSCGCLYGQGHITHGLASTNIYYTLAGIKARCFNPNCKAYKNYGGRGITMYEAWIHDFQAFYDYVSKLPHFGEKGYTLDRINNDGNYVPNNVRWATRKGQNRNQRTNRIVEYHGQLMTMADASEKSGVHLSALYRRLKAGDTGEYLFRPIKIRK